MPLPHRTILFLGAGASAPFDYPTTVQFKTRLKHELSEELLEQRLLKQLISLDQPRDIEGVLSIVDELCGMEMLPQALNFLSSVWPTESKTQEKGLLPWEVVHTAQTMRQIIRDAVFRYYQPKPERDEDVLGIYQTVLRELFKFIRGMNAQEVAGSAVIVTTNYDPVIERFGGDLTKQFVGPVLRDGFSERVDQKGVWNPNWSYSDFSGDRIFLLKVHGSINWIKQRVTGDIIRLPISDRIEYSPEQYYDRVLLYPGSKGQPTDEPFKTLFKLFHDLLETAYTCFVIGYSFRDELINEYLLRFLDDKRKAIYVLSREADANIANLKPQGNMVTRVHKIDCDFGLNFSEFSDFMKEARIRSES